MTNITLFQFFHWYISPQENLWIKAKEQAPCLAYLGITHVWLPPAYKSALGQDEPGYAVYDLYDLGEFDQKGSVRTKYGTRQQYIDCVKAFHDNNIAVLADIVLNHMHGGDEKEKVIAKKVNPDNRNEPLSDEEEIEMHTKFSFPGRQNKYSDYVWDAKSFTGFSENNSDIYMLPHEHNNGEWEEMIDDEKGNFDYLMGADIEFRNPQVREELKRWIQWYIDTTGIDGFRLDALKHISHHFYIEWLDFIRDHYKSERLCIGEYWNHSVEVLLKYLDATGGRIQLFDVPLHFNFEHASKAGHTWDMRTIFDNTLVQRKPELAISFVDNHDTQPLQSLQSPVDPWFKPLAGAMILLREQGLPCVFYPSLYGAKYSHHHDGVEEVIELPKVPCVELLLLTRKNLAYGMQRDYLDHANTIGWTREGIDEKENSGVAIVLTNGSAGNKVMEVGKRHAGKIFIDATGNRQEKVRIDENGIGEFFVNDQSVAVWVLEAAYSMVRG